MDHERIAAELLRYLRGRRSQRAFSQRLGYKSNIAFRWESGRCYPTASQTFHIARETGADVHTQTQAFLSGHAAPDLTTPQGVAAFLQSLRGGRRLVEIASTLGQNRFAVARWLKGTTEPKLPEFLALVDVLSLRLLDFVALFAEPSKLPSLAEPMARKRAAREAAFEQPWSHAVLRTLELSSYKALPRHRPGFIAQLLGISQREEESCLALLERAGQIRRRRHLWVPTEVQTLDLRSEAERLRDLKGFWLDVARQRLQAGEQGVFGFNLFAVSEADLAELRTLYLEFFGRMQALIAGSEPSECVALFSAQLLRLG